MKTKKILFIILSSLLFSSAYLELKGQVTIPANFFGVNIRPSTSHRPG